MFYKKKGTPVIGDIVMCTVKKILPHSVFVSIVRGEEVIVPKGNTVLKPGDDIIALTLVSNEPQLLNLLAGKF